MGDWGFGNFDDDDARDYVDGLAGRIVVRGVPTTAGLSADQVGRWREAFLTAFDRGAADVYDDPADAPRRRRAVERVLKHLEKVARETEADAGPGWEGE